MNTVRSRQGNWLSGVSANNKEQTDNDKNICRTRITSCWIARMASVSGNVNERCVS